MDLETGQFQPKKVTVKRDGYAVKEAEISWENGKSNYEYTLEPQKKTVRITTDPPGGTIELRGQQLKPDAKGVYSADLLFDLDDEGQLRTYRGFASKKKTADSEWERQPFVIEWQDGKIDYQIKLKEILIRRVPLLRVRSAPGDKEWSVAAERIEKTLATKDVTDGPEANKPVKITFLPKDTIIDTLTISPDGANILFTTLSDASGELRSQIYTQPTEGTADVKLLSDGRSLEIMPAYTPNGSHIVFASSRGGRKLSIWSMPATGAPVPEELTGGNGGGSNDLWPTVDSNPSPRLFYQSLLDGRPDPRLFSTPLGARSRKDLTAAGGPATGGTQPRVAPTADAVVFAAEDAKTRKRDIYRMSDQGLDLVNLTNTPNVDEFDAVWSSDGSRIAYVSARSPESPDNFDIFTIDSAGGKPTPITHNASWDDCPAWDPGGRAIYFRSNRGGEWNIWRIELK